MALWKKGERHRSIARNGNVAVTIFFLLFATWVFFQTWSRIGGGPAPVGLDPMVMAALGVAITTKSVEKKADETEMRGKVKDVAGRVWDLEELARAAHPDVAERKLEPQKPPGGRHEKGGDDGV